MSNKLHINTKPLTEDERRQQAMRLAAQKFESFFTGIVFGAVQNPAFDPRNAEDGVKLVEASYKMAEAMMDKLYAPKAKEEQ